MPRSTQIPIGVPADLPERLLELKTRIQSRAAFAAEVFAPATRGSAEAWLIAKLPWGHTTRLLARVKGWRLEPGRNQGVLLGRADSGANP